MGQVAACLLDPETGLTPKQLTFTKKFLETGNATIAAKVAYPSVKDNHVAQNIGSENLAKPGVLEAIEEAYKREGISHDWARLRARQYVDRGIEDSKFAGAGVSALGIAAKILKMVSDEKEVTINVLHLSVASQPASAIAANLSKLSEVIDMELPSPVGVNRTSSKSSSESPSPLTPPHAQKS